MCFYIFLHDFGLKIYIYIDLYYSDIIMSMIMWYITGFRLFDQPFVQVLIKENWLLCGESTGERWIPLTKGPVTRKMFPLDDAII